MPLDCRKAPGKTGRLAMRPLAMGRRRLAGIPAVPAALPAGLEMGEVCGLTSDWFVTEVGVGSTPTCGLGGTRRRRSPLARLRRGCGSATTTLGAGSSSGAGGRG
jgi:hypothetical protein